ncbi:MAG TPA: 2-oxoglutarate dehydrogenase E1 component [Candidatus Kryptonia bacterium]|nr:2-oxoglutarate dehydrogenase E1 component [Candidatus Kryptonia bacterium]
MSSLDFIQRANPDYVEDLYRRYLADPGSVDAQWALFFAGFELARSNGASPAKLATPVEAHGPGTSVFDLIHSYRELGHLIANLDPLGHSPRQHALLDPAEIGVEESDLDRVVDCSRFRGLTTATVRELIAALHATYCESLGVEYMEIADKEQRDWLKERMEPCRNRPALSVEQRKRVLTKLIEAEDFERFLQMKYPTVKRFSLEGGESLIPLLDVMVEDAADLGVEEMVLGMAHRGRLNVLANMLRKPYEMIFAEFEGTFLPKDVQGDGDVKYHLGYSRDHTTRNGHKIHLSLTSNPSHLEVVNPVVEGIVRAKQNYLGDAQRARVVPVQIHGDAAFTGEGIVPETLALSELAAFRTGGTIHIIINNQIGFTTSPSDFRFTRYPSDVAKMIQAPVFHVNGDDPEAAVQAARLAITFRQRFKIDVIIDLVCYRRHGHNEVDDPAFTQPVMYREIEHHPTTRRLYAEQIVRQGVASTDEVAHMTADFREIMDDALTYSRDFLPRQQVFALGGMWKGLQWAGADWSARTAVPAEVLEHIAAAFTRTPAGFAWHPKASRLMAERVQMLAPDGRIDWGCAEALAIGSLLLEGTGVRLSGQDSGRGTFSHRHAVLRDVQSNQPFVPLDHIATNQGRFEIVDTMLSEAAVLGFEYGMSSASPHVLVMWEAQFGDFANMAQVIIDQFIASGESKWQRMNGLVLLLPHGYEGQGPEHSSARLERFLQLCAEDNWQVCNLTTPAQYFHALRRQIHRPFRKPLIVMTPKSLLRHKLAVSTLSEFTDGSFQTVIGDTEPLARERVQRVLLCSGKVYYSLLTGRAERGADSVAIIRVEQLYPFPGTEVTGLLAQYPNARDIRWVQEEPRNMGGWRFIESRLRPLLHAGHTLGYVGRDEAASPATGSYKLHTKEEAEFVNQALLVRRSHGG